MALYKSESWSKALSWAKDNVLRSVSYEGYKHNSKLSGNKIIPKQHYNELVVKHMLLKD